MKRFLLYITILVMIASCGFAATPAKPYADLVDNDVLTATWLIGTFNTIYNWAQATNASVTILMSGAGIYDPLTASFTTSVSSTTQYLVWNSTGLNYVSMVGSGCYGFEAQIVAVASGGAEAAKFKFSGTMISNGTQTALIGDVLTDSWFTNANYTASCGVLGAKSLQIWASCPADVKLKGRLEYLEINY